MDDIHSELATLAAIHAPSPEELAWRQTLSYFVRQDEMNMSVRMLLDRYIDLLDKAEFTPDTIFQLQLMSIKLATRDILISPSGQAYMQRDDGLYPNLFGDEGKLSISAGEGWKRIPWWMLAIRSDPGLTGYEQSRNILNEMPRSHYELYKKTQTIKKICE